jgi:hypothetical protein
MDGTQSTVNSDAECNQMKCFSYNKATITQAEQNSKKLETILVNGTFKVTIICN